MLLCPPTIQVFPHISNCCDKQLSGFCPGLIFGLEIFFCRVCFLFLLEFETMVGCLWTFQCPRSSLRSSYPQLFLWTTWFTLPPHQLAWRAQQWTTRERAVSYKVYKVEDEVVLCMLWPVLIPPYTYEQVCAHTQTKKTKLNHSLILCPPKTFFLLVGVVTVLKNFKVHLTFQLMFSSAKSWTEGDQL